MPVIAIVAGIGSFAAGATAFAAATTTFAAVAAGAAMVGGALTIIGAVTGNQKLSMLGGILSLGAGLAGGMANPFGGTEAAGATGATAGAAEDVGMMGASTAAEGRAAADLAMKSGDLGYGADFAAATDASTALPSAVAESGQSGMIGQVAPETAQAASLPSDVASQVTQVPAGQANAFSTSTDPAAPYGNFKADAANAFKTDAAVQPNTFNADPAFAGKTNADELLSDQFWQKSPVTAPASSSPGMIDKFSAWAKANPELAKTFLETSKGFLGNLVPSDADKARTEAYKAQAAQSAQQTADAKRKALWASGRIIAT